MTDIFYHFSWGGGGAPWGPEKDDKFSQPNHWDGVLEVLGVTGVVHLGQIQSGLRSAIRLVQASEIRSQLLLSKLFWPFSSPVYNDANCDCFCSGKPYQDSHQLGVAGARGRGALDPGARRHRRPQVGPQGEEGVKQGSNEGQENGRQFGCRRYTR